MRVTNTLLNQPKIESFVENVSGNRKGVVWQRPEVGGVRATRAEAMRSVRGALRAQRGGRAAQSAADRQKARPVHSKEPQWDIQDYRKGEGRFASVAKQFPKEAADELFAAAQENAQWRYKSYLRMLGTAW